MSKEIIKKSCFGEVRISIPDKSRNDEHYSLLKDSGFWKFLAILFIVVGSIILFIHFIIVKPMTDSMLEISEKAQARWQAERDKVENMTCDELKNSLLYHKIFASDNSQRATERYVGGCI